MDCTTNENVIENKTKVGEPTALNSVSEFHQMFELPILDKPVIPSKERCELRINLIEEELRELKEAIANDDLVEAADALCDIQYVLSGAILEFGMGSRFQSMFDEVHRSNMSKTCKTLEEAKNTQAYYKTQKHTDSEINERNGQFLVYRKGDGKVLKSVKYSPAVLESFLG